jgi:O-glycosyl hydrolase
VKIAVQNWYAFTHICVFTTPGMQCIISTQKNKANRHRQLDYTTHFVKNQEKYKNILTEQVFGGIIKENKQMFLNATRGKTWKKKR